MRGNRYDATRLVQIQSATSRVDDKGSISPAQTSLAGNPVSFKIASQGLLVCREKTNTNSGDRFGLDTDRTGVLSAVEGSPAT